MLRLEKLDLGEHWPGFLIFTGLALVIMPLVFRGAGVYSRYWRYASVEELLLLAGAVTIAVVLVGAVSPGCRTILGPRRVVLAPFDSPHLSFVGPGSDRRTAPSGASLGAFHDHAAKTAKGVVRRRNRC